MRSSLKAFSFFLVGALAFLAVLTPTNVEAQAVELNADICVALEAAAIVDADGGAIELDVGAIVQVLLALDLGLDLTQPLAVAIAGDVILGGCAAFLPVPDEPASGVMTVVVLDAGGVAIPTATVTFAGIGESGTVNPDGSFTTSAEYAPDTYAFTASAPGYASFDGAVTIVDGNAGTTVTLRALPADGFMTVVVLDAGGNVIPGATVTFTDIDESGTVFPNDGSFTTSTTYAPGTYEFVATADGYGPIDGSVTIVNGNAGTTVNLTALPADGFMTVVVLDADDNIIPGATVTFTDIDESGTVFPNDGSFTTSTEYAPGTYEFVATADGYEPIEGEVTIVDGNAGTTVNLTALPAPGSGYMTVIVLDADDNIIPGAIVTFTDIDESGTVYPNDGSFTTSTVYAPGTYEFTASAVGYESIVGNVVIVEGNASTTVNLDEDPAAETGTVTASVFHCTGITAPGQLFDVGDDCIPGPGTFDFYLIGDGTDDSWRLTVGDDGVNSIILAAGEYEVYEVTTDTRADNVIVTADGVTTFSFGIPRVVPPPTETGILSVSTYTCANLSEPVVLNDIGDDCVRISTDLSFYLWGDGTNEFWPLTTSATGPMDIELPVGNYEVVDEPTQWRVPATVVEDGSSVAFGFPAYQAPVDPVDPDDSDSSDPGKVAPPVTKLPETGVGIGSNIGALSALLGGSILAASAFGVRIRKS